jgi:signal transduction histidine kinase
VTPRPRTLGAQLSRLVVASTLLALAVFTAVAALVLLLEEYREADDDGEMEEDAVEEVFGQLGTAVVVAAPIGLLVALLGARWSARRVTARIDAVIATASRMTADNLSERLPTPERGDELDDLTKALNQLFGRIETGITTLRQFTADASHELRTPLAVMINSLEVARRRARSIDEWERIADGTLEELRHTAELVEALLQSARAGAFDVATEPVDLDAELAALVERWRNTAAVTKIELLADLSSDAWVRIDPRGLAIAVGNLIRNAVAHSPVGGVVTITSRRNDALATIQVIDQGPGVPVDERSRIFEPFARGANPATVATPASGVGLGLSIARRLVEAHGGTLRVDAGPDGGALFVIQLPGSQHA